MVQVVSQATKGLRKITKIGGTGIVGGIITTLVLEFGTQQLMKFIGSQGRAIANTQLIGDSPFLGQINVRDASVLSPSILQLVKAATGKKADIKMILANYGTKALLRDRGLNPNGLSRGKVEDTGRELNIIATELPQMG